MTDNTRTIIDQADILDRLVEAAQRMLDGEPLLTYSSTHRIGTLAAISSLATEAIRLEAVTMLIDEKPADDPWACTCGQAPKPIDDQAFGEWIVCPTCGGNLK